MEIMSILFWVCAAQKKSTAGTIPQELLRAHWVSHKHKGVLVTVTTAAAMYERKHMTSANGIKDRSSCNKII